MTPKESKSEWKPNKLNRWWEFDQEELRRLPVLDETKEWLREGFPEDAAPFLNFGLRSYNGKFHTIADFYSEYELDPKSNDYWIFGSDGSGNPICLDSSNNDSVVLLDHEQEFDVIGLINSNLSELAQCLLEYRRFVKNVQSELGEDAYIEAEFTTEHVDALKKRIEAIKQDLLLTSDFWNNEIENLLVEIE